MKYALFSCAPALLLAGSSLVAAVIDIDLKDAASIRSAAATIAYDMMTYYKGNTSGGIVGVLPGPPPDPPEGYYWWESGAMWGTLVDYWHYTGDSSYNDVLQKGVLHQIGEEFNMMPKNWSSSMGNDDQGFWGMTVMSMAETKFPDPPDPDTPGWVALAQAVFNSQYKNPGHDDTCGGGLRWQVFPYLTGYDYKNSIANGCYFNIGARLAKYTGNDTYAQLAVKSFDWVRQSGLMDADYRVYDGAHIGTNCTDINKVQFSYNAGVFLLGAAHMFNYTDGAEPWRTHVDGLLKSVIEIFFPNGIAYEVACEPHLTCTTDMFSFKAYLLRWLSQTAIVAPHTATLILPILATSAMAAAKQCNGGATGRACGLSWSLGEAYDGKTGVGQEMGALSAFFTNIMALETIVPPVTNATGGTSKGNVNAGLNAIANPQAIKPATTADRAGAGIITTIVLVSVTGMFGWMSI